MNPFAADVFIDSYLHGAVHTGGGRTARELEVICLSLTLPCDRFTEKHTND